MSSNTCPKDYLNKPFCQATLAEHARYNRTDSCRLPVEADVKDFLCVDFGAMIMREKWIPEYDLPHVFHALKACYPEWQFAGERGDLTRYRLRFPSWRRFEVRPGVFEEQLAEGLRFYCLPDDRRRIVLVEPDCSSGDMHGYTIGIIAQRDDESAVAAEANRLWSWMESNHYLRGQALRPDGTLLPLHRKIRWKDIALPPQIRQTIQRNTLDLLKLRPVYQRNGIPLTRGILLHGPPGGGKTLIGKVLANDSAATFIYATAADAEHLSALRHLFALARRLRPTIIFLEDLDLFAFERTSRGMAGSMGELLAQMDGLEENDGIICVATSNDLEAIEPALKDRPSRFDVVLEIGFPDQSCRRRILELNLCQTVVPDEIVDHIGTETDGLSGAQMRELAYLMIQEAIMRGALDENADAQPTWRDAEIAMQRIIKRNKKSLGFASAAPLMDHADTR